MTLSIKSQTSTFQHCLFFIIALKLTVLPISVWFLSWHVSSWHHPWEHLCWQCFYLRSDRRCTYGRKIKIYLNHTSEQSGGLVFVLYCGAGRIAGFRFNRFTGIERHSFARPFLIHDYAMNRGTQSSDRGIVSNLSDPLWYLPDGVVNFDQKFFSTRDMTCCC